MFPGTNHEYKTGEQVPESGQYTCVAGELEDFDRGERFPKCPRTGEETSWVFENKE